MSKVIMALNAVSLYKKLMLRATHLGVRNISLCKALRKDHYETLGLTPNATQAEIKQAYFQLSKLYHPDRISATDDNLAKFREVSAAYEILGNEHSRRLYDKGMLGRFDEKGVQEEEVADPIVKFYKQRQEIAKFNIVVEEEEAWSKKYLKDIKKSASRKHELFTSSEKPELSSGNYNLEVFFILLIVIMLCCNFEGSRVEKMYKELASRYSIF